MGKSLECDLILFLKIAGSAASPQSNDDATADAPFFATRPTIKLRLLLLPYLSFDLRLSCWRSISWGEVFALGLPFPHDEPIYIFFS